MILNFWISNDLSKRYTAKLTLILKLMIYNYETTCFTICFHLHIFFYTRYIFYYNFTIRKVKSYFKDIVKRNIRILKECYRKLLERKLGRNIKVLILVEYLLNI